MVALLRGFQYSRGGVLERLRALMTAGRYRLTLHAEEERDADEITIDDIEEAYSDSASEIIEDYPDDPRGLRHLYWPLQKHGSRCMRCGRFMRTLPF